MLEPQQQYGQAEGVASPPPGAARALDLPRFSADSGNLFDDEPADDDALSEAPRPWWRRRLVAVVAAALVVAVVAGVAVARANTGAKPVTYQYTTVSQGNLTRTVSGTGPVQTATYNLNFASSGRIAEIDVTVGQQVKAGDTLAKLDPTQLQDAVNQAQISANSAYYQEQNALNTCNTENNPPANCWAQAQNTYAAALQQLQTAKDNLANATLKASHDGVVTAINGSVGGTPGSGSSSGSSSSSSGGSGFIQIADPNSLQVQASINEVDISNVATGQNVTFTVSAYSGKVFRGTVSVVSPVGSSSSNVVTYPVTIAVDTSRLNGARLLSGMTATVTIVTAQRVNVNLLPSSAVTFGRAAANTSSGGFITRAQLASTLTQAQQMLATLEQQNSQISQDNPTAAWVVERVNNQWVVKPVVLGLSSGTTYEVLAGLDAGESVVVGEQNGTIKTSSGTSTSGTNGRGNGGFGGGGFGGGGFGGGGLGGGNNGGGGKGSGN